MGDSELRKIISEATAGTKAELKLHIRSLLDEIMNGHANTTDTKVPVYDKSQLETIAEYLSINDLHYTLSVLVAEANLDPTKSYTPKSGLINLDVLKNNQNVKSPDELKVLAKEIWTKLDTKYKWKVKRKDDRRKIEMLEKLKVMEERFQNVVDGLEKQMQMHCQQKIREIEDEKRKFLAYATKDKNVQERYLTQERNDLVAQVRQLELRRAQLQHLEEEFSSDMDLKRCELRKTKEFLDTKETEVRKRELQCTAKIESAVSDTIKGERSKVHIFMKESEIKMLQIQQEVEKLRNNNEYLKSKLKKKTEIEEKMQSMQIQLRQALSDLENSHERYSELKEKLKCLDEFENLKSSNERLKLRIENMKRDDPKEQKIASLERFVENLNSQLLRESQTMLIKDKEWRLNLQQERARYTELVSESRTQSMQLKEMSKQLENLQNQIKRGYEIKKSRIYKPHSFGNDESSTDSSVDLMKEAHHKLKMFNKESQDLESAIRRMRQDFAVLPTPPSPPPMFNPPKFVSTPDEAIIDSYTPRKYETAMQEEINIIQPINLDIALKSQEIPANLQENERKKQTDEAWEARLKNRKKNIEKPERIVSPEIVPEPDRRQVVEKLPISPIVDSGKSSGNLVPDTKPEPEPEIIDPVMQKYMQMVMNKRIEKDTIASTSQEAEEPEVILQLETPRKDEDEFDW